jgi:hypothetical protein
LFNLGNIATWFAEFFGIVMLCAYGDESSDETKQRVFAVGAVIGSEEQWMWLDEKWTR